MVCLLVAVVVQPALCGHMGDVEIELWPRSHDTIEEQKKRRQTGVGFLETNYPAATHPRLRRGPIHVTSRSKHRAERAPVEYEVCKGRRHDVGEF